MSSKDLPKQIPEFPAYPYGPSQWFKQSDRGLYGGQTIQFGNQISEFRNKSRRSWLPNVVRSALWSEVLTMDIRIKVTTSVLRTITKEGGIDNYLTKSTAARIKELGPTGWKLRYRVLQSSRPKERLLQKCWRLSKSAATMFQSILNTFQQALVNNSTSRSARERS